MKKMEENLNYKLLIHDDSYNGEEKFIGILTQERALRMLDRENFCFDTLYIDEAHNILKDDYRSILITRLLKKNNFRNKKTSYFHRKFFFFITLIN